MSSTPTSTPSPFAPVEVVLRDSASFQTEKGETWYYAKAEIPTPDAVWSTCRVKVVHSKPIADGPCKVLITEWKAKDGLAKARIA